MYAAGWPGRSIPVLAGEFAGAKILQQAGDIQFLRGGAVVCSAPRTAPCGCVAPSCPKRTSVADSPSRPPARTRPHPTWATRTCRRLDRSGNPLSPFRPQGLALGRYRRFPVCGCMRCVVGGAMPGCRRFPRSHGRSLGGAVGCAGPHWPDTVAASPRCSTKESGCSVWEQSYSRIIVKLACGPSTFPGRQKRILQQIGNAREPIAGTLRGVSGSRDALRSAAPVPSADWSRRLPGVAPMIRPPVVRPARVRCSSAGAINHASPSSVALLRRSHELGDDTDSPVGALAHSAALKSSPSPRRPRGVRSTTYLGMRAGTR